MVKLNNSSFLVQSNIITVKQDSDINPLPIETNTISGSLFSETILNHKIEIFGLELKSENTPYRTTLWRWDRARSSWNI